MTAVDPGTELDPSRHDGAPGTDGGGPTDGVGVDDAPSASPTHRARSVVLAAVLGLLALWALDVYAVPAFGRVRQQHLSDEYREAVPKVRVGDAALLLQIPALRLNEVVVKGATPDLLEGGPGWREGSAPPGDGNTVLLGRSTRWTHPFARLAEVPEGAGVFVRTRDGRVYRYRVEGVRTVAAARTAPMEATGRSRLTLVTSAAGPFDTRRTVVVARQVGTGPETPEEFAEPVRKVVDLGPYDERSPGGLLLLLTGFLVAALGVVGVLELRTRYSTATLVVVAGPALALGVVLVLFHLDAFLPITY